MHANPDLRVFLKWMIARSGSVITDVIQPRLMRFTIRQLMFAMAVLALIFSLPLAIYRSYNHHVASFDVGNGIEIEFRSQYESWRGPRKILSVKIWDQNSPTIDLTARVPTYYFVCEPKLYFSSDRKHFCVTYPCRNNYILGDITTKQFGTRYMGKFPYLVWNHDDHKVADRWRPVLESIKSNNPELVLDQRNSQSPF